MPKKIRKRTHALSVSEVAQEFYAAMKHLRPRTQDELVQRLGVFASWCDEHQISLSQINAATVNQFVDYLKESRTGRKTSELSTYTLSGYVRVIKRFLNWCVEQPEYNKLVSVEVVRQIKRPKIIETIIDVFSTEQIEALFDACKQEESEHLQMRDRAIVALLLDTGIRANELVTLTLAHVHLDPKDSYIRVLGKGGKWGEVGLGDRSRQYIRWYVREYRNPTIEYAIRQERKNITDRQVRTLMEEAYATERLFVSRIGDPLTTNGLYQIIARLGEWAGITGIRCSPHSFRHTFAVNFIRQGGDIYRLSRLLRHTSVSVTEEYLKSLSQTEARKGQKSVLNHLDERK